MTIIPGSICCGVGKGGVGKTAIATTLAALWARDGMRVLLVDADAQANATLAVGIVPEEHGSGRHFNDAVVYDEELKVTPARPNLDVVTAGRHITDLAHTLVADKRAAERFAEVFLRISDSYDRLIVDVPPAGGASRIPTIALTACEYLLVPTTDQYLAIEGLRVLGDDLLDAQSEIILLGVVLYMTPAASKRARAEALTEIRAILGDSAEPFETMIRYAPAAYNQALKSGNLIHEYHEWAIKQRRKYSLGDRIKAGFNIPGNLDKFVEEFEALAVEVNARIEAIESATRSARSA